MRLLIKKRLTKVTHIFDRTLDLLASLAGAILIFIMLVILFEVVWRGFTGGGIIWSVEIIGYLLLFITLLGTAWVLKRGAHVKVDVVLNQLNPRTRSLVNAITFLITAIACFIIVWYGVKVTWRSYQIGYFLYGALRVPESAVVFIVPVGSFFLFIQFLRMSYGYLGEWRAPPARKQGLERK